MTHPFQRVIFCGKQQNVPLPRYFRSPAFPISPNRKKKAVMKLKTPRIMTFLPTLPKCDLLARRCRRAILPPAGRLSASTFSLFGGALRIQPISGGRGEGIVTEGFAGPGEGSGSERC